MIKLRNSISEFQKGKATLDNLLKSQKSHGDTQGIGYENRISCSSSSHINFIKSSCYSTPSSSKPNESQTFKVKRSQVSNTKVKSNKTQSFMTQRERTHTRKPQLKHAYMYTRHNNHKYISHHNAHEHIIQNYYNRHYHCQCMSHIITQKSYRKHPPQHNTRHVSHTRKAYHPKINKFANVECFYCMTKCHTSNVCFYRRLHLNMLPLDYLETNQPRPRNVWVQKNV